MAGLNTDELAQQTKEKAEQAQRVAYEAIEKAKNMSVDDAKELAKEQAKKTASEAAETLKKMSIDDTTKMKFGGITLLIVLVLVFLFSGSSYNEEFIKSQIKVPSGHKLGGYDILSEEEIEVFGKKGIELVLDVTLKNTSGKFICAFDEKGFTRVSSYTSKERSQEKCLNRKGAINPMVLAIPDETYTKEKTIIFGKTDYEIWEKKHS